MALKNRLEDELGISIHGNGRCQEKRSRCAALTLQRILRYIVRVEVVCIVCLVASISQAQTNFGVAEVIEDVVSPELGNHRALRVYLPAAYRTEPERHFPVLYMHDGQNLFDPALSFSGVAWDVGTTLDALIAAGEVAPIIVVGIDSTQTRIEEYTPCCDPKHGGGKLDAYTKFFLNTVKPLVDFRYRTIDNSSGTALMGSSLGGLASVEIALANPDKVGMAAGISSSFWWNGGEVIQRARQPIESRFPQLYLDAGTVDDGLANTIAMCAALIHIGYNEGRNLECALISGGRHHERDWAARLARPLKFLFPAKVCTGDAGMDACK